MIMQWSQRTTGVDSPSQQGGEHYTEHYTSTLHYTKLNQTPDQTEPNSRPEQTKLQTKPNSRPNQTPDQTKLQTRPKQTPDQTRATSKPNQTPDHTKPNRAKLQIKPNQPKPNSRPSSRPKQTKLQTRPNQTPDQTRPDQTPDQTKPNAKPNQTKPDQIKLQTKPNCGKYKNRRDERARNGEYLSGNKLPAQPKTKAESSSDLEKDNSIDWKTDFFNRPLSLLPVLTFSPRLVVLCLASAAYAGVAPAFHGAAYAAPAYGAAYAAPAYAAYAAPAYHGAAYGVAKAPVFAAAAAPVVARAPVYAAAAAPVVAKQVVQEVYAPQPYKFGYNTVDEYGNQQSRHEEADAYNNRVGSYSFTDAYGLSRRVDYVADAAGFRASVHTNEPGTAASAPAAAVYNTPVVAKVAKVAAPVVAAAPAVHAPVYAAPAVAKVAAAPAYAAYAAPAYAAPAYAKYGGYGERQKRIGRKHGRLYLRYYSNELLLAQSIKPRGGTRRHSVTFSCAHAVRMFAKLVFLAVIAGAFAQFVVQQPFFGQQPYHFSYEVPNPVSGSHHFHTESADENNERSGSYGYTDAFGLYRRVDYTAGAAGFQASVSSNEPGTSQTPSAAVAVGAPGFF
ncbi:uncharacterized protein LOC135366325 [Ornithodoros turicata]|uniref:uncharacterized protein LOC135366325 n=1 Tax=Ornithodoros turicata TaxID=34597 RepID=UPI00313A220C